MTLDTNIIIAYLGGEESVVEALSEWKQNGVTLILPATVEAEILSFPKFLPPEQSRIEDFLERNFIFVPCDRAVSRATAAIRRKHKVKFADATIAATAILTNTTLVTRNTRDFEKIPGLGILKI